MPATLSIEKVRSVLDNVFDPEVPVLSVNDLGVVRDVELQDGKAVVTVTPTYSGCPAMDTIRMQIRMALAAEGIENEIKTQLSPAWTTDWISLRGRDRLKAYGIAPPRYSKKSSDPLAPFAGAEPVNCPRCKGEDTRLVSEFGSTACKSLYFCNSCQEPFDYFKCH